MNDVRTKVADVDDAVHPHGDAERIQIAGAVPARVMFGGPNVRWQIPDG